MKKIILATVAATLPRSGAASAADMPARAYKAAPSPAMAVYN